MQLKQFLRVFIVGLILSVVFCSGYTVGKSINVRRALSVAIPLHVLIYRNIKNGNSDQAAAQTALVLRGKVERFDSLSSDWIFRMAGGNKLFDSTNLQQYVSGARNIFSAEKTNIVTIGPENNN